LYNPVLAIVDWRLLKKDDKSLDYGLGTVLFSLETPVDGRKAAPGDGVHVAFIVRSPSRLLKKVFWVVETSLRSEQNAD
jgi:hypothetical protein